MIVALVALNVVGVARGGRKLRVTLGSSTSRRRCCSSGSASRSSSARAPVENVHWGVAPTWSNLAMAIPVAMLAYTGVETVSNLAEEVPDPCAAPNGPSSWLSLSSRSTSPAARRAIGAPGRGDRRRADDALWLFRRKRAGTRTTPFSGGRQPRPGGIWLDEWRIYVGILAATILLIATNAGVIGASRITYSMATYQQYATGTK